MRLCSILSTNVFTFSLQDLCRQVALRDAVTTTQRSAKPDRGFDTAFLSTSCQQMPGNIIVSSSRKVTLVAMSMPGLYTESLTTNQEGVVDADRSGLHCGPVGSWGS